MGNSRGSPEYAYACLASIAGASSPVTLLRRHKTEDLDLVIAHVLEGAIGLLVMGKSLLRAKRAIRTIERASVPAVERLKRTRLRDKEFFQSSIRFCGLVAGWIRRGILDPADARDTYDQMKGRMPWIRSYSTDIQSMLRDQFSLAAILSSDAERISAATRILWPNGRPHSLREKRLKTGLDAARIGRSLKLAVEWKKLVRRGEFMPHRLALAASGVATLLEKGLGASIRIGPALRLIPR